jgi:hypothetical protein
MLHFVVDVLKPPRAPREIFSFSSHAAIAATNVFGIASTQLA